MPAPTISTFSTACIHWPPNWSVLLQPEFAQGRMIIRPSSQWPMVLALSFLDREIVNAGNASAHQSLLVKFPVLVAIAAEPIAAVVMPFVSKPYRDTVLAKCPDFLDEAVIQLLAPFARQKCLRRDPERIPIGFARRCPSYTQAQRDSD